MADLAVLRALKERVDAAKGPDRTLDGAIWAALEPKEAEQLCGFRGLVYAGHRFTKAEKASYIVGWRAVVSPELTASVDAALALVERVLPGWTTDVHTADASPETYSLRKDIIVYDDGGCAVTLAYCHPKIEPRDIGDGFHKSSIPLAILSALLSALIAQQEQTDAH